MITALSFSDDFATMLNIKDNYTTDTIHFVRYLRDTDQGICVEAIKGYAAALRETRDGKRYAARTINKRQAGMKDRVRMLIKKEELTGPQAYPLEAALQNCKNEKINSNAVKEDKILTKVEIMHLIKTTHDKRLSLIMEFFWLTGCSISETLIVLLSDCDTGLRHVMIRMSGKGSKERMIKLPTEVYTKIRNKFNGKKYLFEHSGKTYSRTSISYRIKVECLQYLGKNISASSLRHSFAIDKIEKTGKIGGVSKYLGHSSISTTMDMYCNEELNEEDLNI